VPANRGENGHVREQQIDAREEGLKLFLVGFLVLFLELACIRWFAAYVIFLQFFTNVVLLASFLGMSCGCMAAQRRRDWLAPLPLIALGTVVASVLMLLVYRHWSGIAIDVGSGVSPRRFSTGPSTATRTWRNSRCRSRRSSASSSCSSR